MEAEKKIATRNSYGTALRELGAEFENIIVLDADLAGSTRTGMFAAAFPDRFFNCGIAEANMMGVAAGLATMGFVPFVSSFAMFAACRPYEQVRTSIGYPHLNVKIGASHAGISVGEDGATHQCCEDFALMRTIPGMTVLCPADDVEARQMVRAAYHKEGPVYMRFGRAVSPVFHTEDYHFEIGKGEVLREGKDIAIIATGITVPEAIDAADLLVKNGIHARLINMSTVKPIDRELVKQAAEECGRILTVEEHSIIGGLGDAVCSVVLEELPVPVKKLGLNDRFGFSGPAEALMKEFGLCAENIAKEAEQLINKRYRIAGSEK